MAQCCHPLCCLELNGLYINTTTLFPCLEKHLTVRSAVCSVVLKKPYALVCRHSNEVRQTGHTAEADGTGRLCFLTPNHQVSIA